MPKRGQVGNVLAIIGTVVFVLMFLAVIPTVAIETAKVTNTTAGFTGQNVTGASNALVGLTPLIFVSAGIIAALAYFRGS